MCGRFFLLASGDSLARHLGLANTPSLPLRYNIAPTQSIPAVRVEQGIRSLAMLKWSLIPSWSKDGKGWINARADTAANKPAFRSAFRKRRCLIPASGFFEWKPTGARQKQPYLIRLKGYGLLAFAGIWDSWQGTVGVLETCAILTTTANALMAPIHDRMPCILARRHYNAWLKADADVDELQKLLRPYPYKMEAVRVSNYVNNARQEGPRCLTPA
jgi:putative SOS response-associated peptidase YedK